MQNDTGGAHPDEHRLPRAPDGYVLLSRLGGGGMGEVHLAREDTSERLVAIKFLRFPGSREDFERFRLELRVLANLDHPNIVRVLAPDFNGADPCFAMEYLPGGSLARPTEGAAPMAVDRAVQIARAVALACGVAHAARVIHRDLKPSNILLTADGVPKVVDFGLAKRLGAADPLTRDSGALGTPEYMPPEQISQKNGDLGPCADVYGLGATLYHLLTGRVPFVGHSPEEVVMRVLTDLPQRPRALRPEIPLALEGIVLKCLEKDPADRYPSMAELAADLDRFSTPGQTPLAPRLTRRRRARRWVVRHRNGLTIACAIAALLGVTFVLGRVQSGAKRGVTPAPVRRVELAPVPGTPVLLPSPEITHQEAVRDLRAGRSVVLVGPSGPRVPLAWVLGSGEVVLAPADKEARLSLRTGETGSSILELLPDPGIERYRVRAVIRHDQWIPPRGGAASTPSEIGVVIGHQRVAAAQKDGRNGTAHALALVALCDPAGHDPKAGRGVWCADYDFLELPLQPLRRCHRESGRVPLAPADGSRWRTLEIDVEPDRLTVRHGENTHTRDRAALEHGRELTERMINVHHNPSAPISFGPWSSRLPIGLWVQCSWVSVRSFSIEPLP